MKAWQLTIGLAVLAVAAGQLPPEDLRAHVEAPTSIPCEVEDPQTARAHAAQARVIDRLLRDDPSIRSCFADTTGESRILMHMRLLANGRVDEICITDPATAVGSDAATCLMSAVRSMSFPKPADGVPVSVTYPFER